MDTIFIKDLLVRCIIGINDEERHDRQDVLINIALTADLSKPCRSDKIEDAVDYRAIKKKVFEIAENSGFFLVEALAETIAAACLDFTGVKAVKVLVEKPSALRFARSVGIEINREKA